MAQNETRNLSLQAAELDQILRGEKDYKTAGEYMEGLRRKECTAMEAEDTAFVLAYHKGEFIRQKHFNDDYRPRVLSWLARYADQSSVVKAAHATLANLASASKGNTVESLAEAAKQAATCMDPRQAFLACVAAPDIWDTLKSSTDPDIEADWKKLNHLVETFLSDKEAVIANITYIRMACRFLGSTIQGAGQMLKAFKALATKNVTPSSTPYKALSANYRLPEITALNLACASDMWPGPVLDNIMKNFLSCVAGRGEDEPFTESEAETLQSVLGRNFSRKVAGSKSTWDYFHGLVAKFDGSYHIAALDIEDWERLYYALDGKAIFQNAGFMAFDPLDAENSRRWEILSAKHKKLLLNYRCAGMFRKSLCKPYQESWKEEARAAERLLASLQTPEGGQGQQDSSPACCRDLYSVTNALVQAGVIDIPDCSDHGWTYSVELDMRLSYLLQYHREHGGIPGWVAKLFQGSTEIDNMLTAAENPAFTDDDKQELCGLLSDIEWENNPCGYYHMALDLLLKHQELARIALEGGTADIARVLLQCMPLSDCDRQALRRYTMDEEEWERRKKLDEKRRQEEEELENLRECQEIAWKCLEDIVEKVTNSRRIIQLTHSDIRRADPILWPELARVATHGIRERDIPVTQKIKTYAVIAELSECDAYLFEELENIIKERK